LSLITEKDKEKEARFEILSFYYWTNKLQVNCIGNFIYFKIHAHAFSLYVSTQAGAIQKQREKTK
jgi:hypothetical protein